MPRGLHAACGSSQDTSFIIILLVTCQFLTTVLNIDSLIATRIIFIVFKILINYKHKLGTIIFCVYGGRNICNFILLVSLAFVLISNNLY